MPIVGLNGPWLTQDGTGRFPIVDGPFCGMCGMLRENMLDDSFFPARMQWATILLDPFFHGNFGVYTGDEAWNLVTQAAANTYVCTPCGNLWWHTSPNNPDWPLSNWRHSMNWFNANIWPTQPVGTDEGGLYYCATVNTRNTTPGEWGNRASLAVPLRAGCEGSAIPSSPSTDSNVSGYDPGKYVSSPDTSESEGPVLSDPDNCEFEGSVLADSDDYESVSSVSAEHEGRSDVSTW